MGNWWKSYNSVVDGTTFLSGDSTANPRLKTCVLNRIQICGFKTKSWRLEVLKALNALLASGLPQRRIHPIRVALLLFDHLDILLSTPVSLVLGTPRMALRGPCGKTP